MMSSQLPIEYYQIKTFLSVLVKFFVLTSRLKFVSIKPIRMGIDRIEIMGE